MSDLNGLRGAGRSAFNPPGDPQPAAEPRPPAQGLPLEPPLADELSSLIPSAEPAPGPQGGERLAGAGGADYGALPWDEAMPPPAPALLDPAAATNAVDRAKAWGQRLIQGL